MPQKKGKTTDYSSGADYSSDEASKNSVLDSKKRKLEKLENNFSHKKRNTQEEMDQKGSDLEQKETHTKKRIYSEKSQGRMAAKRCINGLLAYREPSSDKSPDYVAGYKTCYDDLYENFEGIRDDSDIEQLAHVLGRYDMAKTGVLRKRPKDKKARLNIHWKKYVAGAESYQDPLAKLDLEKMGVGGLFLLIPSSKTHEAGRNLAAEDCIHGKEKKTPKNLAEINSSPEFIQSYQDTYDQFKNGHYRETASMRQGKVSTLVSRFKEYTPSNDAYFAGKKYALYKMMRANKMTRKPNSNDLAIYFGNKDASSFKIPLKAGMSVDYEKRYLKTYNATLDEIDRNSSAEKKNVIQLFKAYRKILDQPISKQLYKELDAAKEKAFKAYRSGSEFKPDPEKLKCGDPLEITYQFFYCNLRLRKGDKSEAEIQAIKGRNYASMAINKGAKAKTPAQIEKMRRKKGNEFTDAYLERIAKEEQKKPREKLIFQFFYAKGKLQAARYIREYSATWKSLDFDKNDELHRLKEEAYLLGFLKGLETKNEAFGEKEREALSTPIRQKLNVIYRNSGHKASLNREDLNNTVNDINATHASLDHFISVGKVSVLNGEKGLFTCRTIEKGECFLEFFGQAKLITQIEELEDVIRLDGDRVKVATQKENFANYANHSDNPNARLVVLDDDVVMIEALEVIEAGQQVIINYGHNYSLANKIGLNPWDNEATSDRVYENNSRHYSFEPYYFAEDFANELGLPTHGSYLITQLIRAMLEGEDEVFDKALKKEVLELPMLAVEDDNSQLVFSDLNLNYYCNALMLACFIGSITYVTKLLEAGARGNVLQRNNNSLFHIVFRGRGTEKEKIELALLLLKNLINPFVLNNDQMSFISFMDKTITSKHLKLSVLEMLEPKAALLFSCHAGSRECVEWFVKKHQHFDLSCLVEGRLNPDFRKKLAIFLKTLGENDKKLFETLLGYATLRSYEEYSSTTPPTFFKAKNIGNSSENRLIRHFQGITQVEFESLYQFLKESEIFNLYPAMNQDLLKIKSEFNVFNLEAMVIENPTTDTANTYVNDESDNDKEDDDDDYESEEFYKYSGYSS